MWKGSILKAGLFYLFGVIALTYYGIEVCPYLDNLKPIELAGIFAPAFLIAGVFRMLILKGLDQKEQKASVEVNLQKPWRHLRVDLGIWVLTGLLVSVWNLVRYDFPAVSGLKVILGCVTLGIFSAAYLALNTERELILSLEKEGNLEGLKTGGIFSITTKFMVFIGLSLTVITVVVLLLIYKDFTYVIEALSHGRPFEFAWVIQEVLFVFGILLGGTTLVARQYSRNLKLMFDLQMKAFDAVEKGKYDTFVPVVSRDEFSLIAEQTNQMIVGLREKERIERAFGKYMSPTVAEAILSSEGETHLGGRQVEAAILFTDLRNFTPLSERCTAQTVCRRQRYRDPLRACGSREYRLRRAPGVYGDRGLQ